MVNKDTQDYFSRSALAEKLGVTLKELTQVLIDSGWLRHDEQAVSRKEKHKEWQLTEKGKFEGGTYRESKKYGPYIVWPATVLSHRAITQLLESRISATLIGRHYDMSARIVNRLMAEIGWLKSYAKGWQLTSLGEAQGGLQKHDQQSGIPYVVWPRSLLDDKYFSHQVHTYQVKPSVTKINIDGTSHYRTLDGRYLPSIQDAMIANWLYLHGLSYSYHRELALSTEKTIQTDFYLPDSRIYILYNGAVSGPNELSHQLSRQALAEEYQLKVIELSLSDIDTLDQVLPKALLRWDIEC